MNKLFPEDREKVKEFLPELIAKGYSFARVNRYMYSICSQAKSLGGVLLQGWLPLLYRPESGTPVKQSS